MDNYQYQPLNQEPPGFRLLKLRKAITIEIECEMFYAVIPDCHCHAVFYEALSYTWGNTELVEIITVNGQQLWITENLHSALQCLRHRDQDRVLWIDAICINQLDKEEQSRQVLMMGRIFSFATRVLFWLGKPTAEAALLMRSLGELETKSRTILEDSSKARSLVWKELWCSPQQRGKFLNSDCLVQQRKGLEVLLRRPWFDRVWILQEVLNAQSAIVCVGTFSVSAGVFASSPSLLNINTNAQVQSVLDLMPKSSGINLQDKRERKSLHDLLLRFHASKATDRRDMIFALLGMSSEPFDHRLLRPDYTQPLEEVVRNTIRYWFEISDLKISQVLQFLVNFRTIYATLLVPPNRAKAKTEMTAVQSRLDLIPCVRDTALFVIERFSGEPSTEQDAFYIELSKLNDWIAYENRVRSEKARVEQYPLDVIPWEPLQQRVNLLIVSRAKEALLIIGSLECRRVFNFVVDKTTDDKSKLLHGTLHEALQKENWNAAWLVLENDANIDIPVDKYGEALCGASKAGCHRLVELLLDKDVDFNTQAGTLIRALHSASEEGENTVVQMLIEKGADVNAQGEYGNAIQLALQENHVETAQLLLKNGAHISTEGGSYNSVFLLALGYHYMNVVELLFEHGMRVGIDTEFDEKALQTALSTGSAETLKLLIDKGMDTKCLKSSAKWLEHASTNGDIELVQLLLDNGVPRNARYYFNSSPLRMASSEGHVRVVKLLLDRGADVNAPAGDKVDALYAAAKGGYIEVVKLLIDNGAGVNASTGRYCSVLQAAVKGGHAEVVKLLLDNGADVNASTGRKGNALQAATHGNHMEVVKLLLDNGADVNAPANLFGSALQNAVLRCPIEIVQLLLDSGADVNAPAGPWGTALQAAAKRSYKHRKEVVQLLLDRGADKTMLQAELEQLD